MPPGAAPDAARAEPPRRWLRFGLFLFTALTTVPLLGLRDVWPSDEPRYALVGREIVRDGDWIVMHVNQERYTEKPPLYFWCESLLGKWFGDVTPFASRLPSALGGALGVVLCFELGRRLYGARVALAGALVLATTQGWCWISQRCALDVMFSAFILGALLLEEVARERLAQGRAGHAKALRVGAFAVAAGGFLVKGPPVVIFVLVALVARAWAARDLRSLARVPWLLGPLSFLLVLGMWGVPWAMRLGFDTVGQILHHQTTGRMSSSFAHQQPWHFFLRAFPNSFLPWSIAWAVAAWLAWRRRGARREAPAMETATMATRFLLGFAAVAFVLFSCFSGKRTLYLLPIFPAVALLTAALLAHVSADATRAMQRVTRLAIAGGILSLAAGFVWIPRNDHGGTIGGFPIAAQSLRPLGEATRRHLDAGRTVVLVDVSHPEAVIYESRALHLEEIGLPEEELAEDAEQEVDCPRLRELAAEHGAQLVLLMRSRVVDRVAAAIPAGVEVLERLTCDGREYTFAQVRAEPRQTAAPPRRTSPPDWPAVAAPAPRPAAGSAPRPAAGSAPFWGELEHGPFVVGFTSSWELDATRPYQMKFADGTTYAPERAPRPVLMNVWYPARVVAGGESRAAGRGESSAAEGEGPPMVHGDYLDIAASDPQVDHFAAQLVAFDRDVIVQSLLRRAEATLDAPGRAALEDFLATPTACVRDAEPGDQRCPLVIYHSGYGSSFEDNAVLCEYLASHGYVVAGSAFPTGDGSSFNIDAFEGSARDTELMVAKLAGRPDVDASRLALIGHSGGAHCVIRERARPTCTARATVSLDTTQDYWMADDPRWRDFTAVALGHLERYTTPMLFAASPYAIFSVPDRLTKCERWLFTADLDHGEFVAQGVTADEQAARANPLDAEIVRRAKVARAGYTRLCRTIRRFLDTYLKDSPSAEPAFDVERMAIGRDAPAPLPEGFVGVLPPRQVRPYLAAHGRDATIALLKAAYAAQPDAPIFHQLFAAALMYELSASGRVDDARAIGAAFREFVPDLIGTFAAQGEYFAKVGSNEYARMCFEQILLLDPEDARAKQKVTELAQR